MNELYWKKYYKEVAKKEPSEFAKFCRPYVQGYVLEVASGDGRDVKYLGTKTVIEPNNNYSKDSDFLDVGVYKMTFEDFYKLNHDIPNVTVYARWFLHAVPEETENLLIKYATWQKGTLMLEFRAEGDMPDNTHKRRLINVPKLTLKLLKSGFTIKYMKLSHDFSPGTDNPYLCRIIAKYES